MTNHSLKTSPILVPARSYPSQELALQKYYPSREANRSRSGDYPRKAAIVSTDYLATLLPVRPSRPAFRMALPASRPPYPCGTTSGCRRCHLMESSFEGDRARRAALFRLQGRQPAAAEQDPRNSRLRTLERYNSCSVCNSCYHSRRPTRSGQGQVLMVPVPAGRPVRRSTASVYPYCRDCQ